jgi:hypothetical protein
MAEYVLNEWIWADALGENGRSHQIEALQVLEGLDRGPDSIVVVNGSRFHAKAWKLCSATTPPARQIGRDFKMKFLYNSLKCRLLDETELAEIPSSLQGVKPDDRYLVRAQLTVPGSIIVTTDAPLKTILDAASIPCEHREQFVSRYAASKRGGT